MSFPKYEKYKDSGVESIGLLPLAWNCAPLKYTTQVYTGNSLNDEEKVLYDLADESAYPYISSKDIDVNTRNINYNNGLRIPTENKQFKIAPKGSFLLCIEGGSAGKKVGLLKENVCFVNKLCCFTGDLNRFKYYFVQSLNFKSIFQISITGLIGGVSTNQLKNFNIPIPPHNEVLEIVKFLDCETAKIDELVAEQQRLIELLKEKRQAVISHAVTRGLNPNVKLKPSGIEWLGDVPAHWEVKRIKHLSARISSGKTPSGGSEVYVDEGITFLRSQNVYDEGLYLDDVVFITKTVDEAMSSSRVSAGDILLNITGASIGRSCLVPQNLSPANVNQHVCVIRLKEPSNTSFVGWVFKSKIVKDQIDYAQNGAAREGLNFAQIGEMIILLPPVVERETITAFLEQQTIQFDNLIAEAQHAIDILQERRTALISAVVTGKIDVRQLKKIN